MNTTDYSKLLTNIRTQLLAHAREDERYEDCLRMLEFAQTVHQGVRKDGVTKEFYHQLSIVGVLLTQHRNLDKPYLVYQAALGHDLIEDYPENKAYVKTHFPEAFPFCWTLSKVRDGNKIPYAQYFSELGNCPVSSAVKLIDRLHNLSTMVDVFEKEKQIKYVREVDVWFLPMLKRAKRLHPRQADFMELAKSMLQDATHLLKFYLGMEREHEKVASESAELGA